MQEFIKSRRAEIAELCRMHNVRRLAVFGSAVRDDFDPERSDVDLLFEFDSDSADQYFRRLGEFEEGLVRLFRRNVDLVEPNGIRNPYVKRTVLQDLKELHAA